MRSVVVVLPASMCAMIPMLRTLSRAFVATVGSSSSQIRGWVPHGSGAQNAPEGSTRTAPREDVIFPRAAAGRITSDGNHDRWLTELLSPSTVTIDRWLTERLSPSTVTIDRWLTERLSPSTVTMTVTIDRWLT